MPTNRNASFRYRVLNECFRNTARQWTLPALVEKVSEELYEQFGIDKGIRQRQIQEDINVMRSDPPRGFGAPIVCKQGCYFYSDAAFSIDKTSLNAEDVQSLSEAVKLLKQFKGLSNFQELEAIIAKIEGKALGQEADAQIISFEQVELTHGQQWLERIRQAIRHEHPLVVTYQGFQAPSSGTFELHPYHLKEYRGRWYVLGWEAVRQQLFTFPLDRIIEIQNASSQFIPNHSFDPVTYFADVVGITRPADKEPEEIRVRIAQISAPYAQTKPIHASQKVIESTAESVTFRYWLIPNFEFEAELLRLGDAVEVLSPTWLRDRFRERLQRAAAHY